MGVRGELASVLSAGKVVEGELNATACTLVLGYLSWISLKYWKSYKA